jgi:uncharacterized membrane protein YhaH (DUF805 family)
MATFLWFLFDWRGRLKAGSYRIALLVLAGTVAALHVVPFRNPNFLLGIAATQLLIQASLDAKRLHDIGRSATWILLTSAAGVAGFAKLYTSMPDLMPALMERMAEQIGPQANSPVAFIAFAGLTMAAALRSPLLSVVGSRESGAAYDHDPLARVKAKGDGETSKLDADALIAKALEEHRLKDAAAAMRQTAERSAPSGAGAIGARKAFGRRVA